MITETNKSQKKKKITIKLYLLVSKNSCKLNKKNIKQVNVNESEEIITRKKVKVAEENVIHKEITIDLKKKEENSSNYTKIQNIINIIFYQKRNN